MKYIVELVEVDDEYIHNVYFKRWWFSKKKFVGTKDHGGIVNVKDEVMYPHFIDKFIRYDFINTIHPQNTRKNLKC